MNNTFCCLTTFFNPAGYLSRIINHHLFAEAITKQQINLLTIELAFGTDDFYLKPAKDVIHMRSNSVLWQKERMLNHAMSKLPAECKYVAWVDGDVLFDNNHWAEMAIDRLQTDDIIQLFQEVRNLPPHETSLTACPLDVERGIVWQSKTDNWLEKRKTWKLPYATVGFAWAAKRSIFDSCGMYDRHILGSNDNVIIDCCLNSFDIHHYWRNITPKLKEDMQEWTQKFGIGIHKVGYLPITIYHLFHGAKKYRGYLGRETTLGKHDFDPTTDIAIKNDVYEWNSDKPQLHKECKNYFYTRREDDETIPDDPHTRL